MICRPQSAHLEVRLFVIPCGQKKAPHYCQDTILSTRNHEQTIIRKDKPVQLPEETACDVDESQLDEYEFLKERYVPFGS